MGNGCKSCNCKNLLKLIDKNEVFFKKNNQKF